MKHAFAATLLLLATSVCAVAAEQGAPFESIEINCSGAPSAAKTDFPSDAEKWAKLSCTKYGQVIRAASGWVWHAPRTNQFVRLWAQPTGPELTEASYSNYFTAIEFRKLSQSEAEEANQTIATSLGAKPQSVSDAYVLTATDNQGRVQTVNFVRTEANIRIGNMWGWSCSVPCTAPTVFMAFKP